MLMEIFHWRHQFAYTAKMAKTFDILLLEAAANCFLNMIHLRLPLGWSCHRFLELTLVHKLWTISWLILPNLENLMNWSFRATKSA